MKKKYMGGGMMKRDMEGEMMDRMGRGMAKAEMQEKAMKKGGIAEAIKKHEKSSVAHKAGLKSGGMAKKSGVTRADGVIKKAHTKGTMIKMAEGGMAMVMKNGKKVPEFAADGKGKMANGGKVRK